MPKIKVHEKALAHLSRGLYRSPASALRELVSNAWDANATVVRVDTAYPTFLQVAVDDNGDGFTLGDFERVMKGGIGNSDKRTDGIVPKHGRPLIGRLGIGMFGIAQIAPGFTITSKTADGSGFRARIKLYDLLKEKLDKEDADVVTETPLAGESLKEVHIGTYEIDDDFDPSTRATGTTIIADDLHPQFTTAFRDSISHPGFKPVPSTWAEAINILSKVESLQLLGDYWRLLWELAAATPVCYVNEHAVPEGAIRADQRRLKEYDFRVFVDDVELLKPVNLKDESVDYLVHKIPPTSKKVYAKDVSFHGYIAARDGSQIKPDELRGLMLRIKNIGIGYYDQTLLDFRVNQGPRSRWITGEIYVDTGLEDALNVDRDSFNRFHPEFRHIQSFIHDMLKKEVFPDVYRKMESRSEHKVQKKEKTRKKHLATVVGEQLDSDVTIRVAPASDEATEDPRAKVTETKDGVVVTLPPPESLHTKKAAQQSAAAILAVFEVALREATKERQREVFTDLLLKLLKGW
jgi:hypothetical protein